jgi:hypothetical protein
MKSLILAYKSRRRVLIREKKFDMDPAVIDFCDQLGLVTKEIV